MSKQPDAARRHEKNADELREQAQRLYDAASPEQKERMRRWVQDAARRQQDRDLAGGDQEAREMGARGPGSTRGGGDPRREVGQPAPDQSVRTEPVDARAAHVPGDEPPNEQVVAEWLGRGGERHSPTDPAVVQGRLREAARSAERAIGDRTVPGRYDRILREYFKRLPDKLAPAPPRPRPRPPRNPQETGQPQRLDPSIP
jgi:hypothetical protein